MLGWLSLDSIPTRTTLCIALPNSELWQSQFLGAFLELTKAENWEEHGALSSEEMADEWRSVFFNFVDGTCSMIPVGTILEYGGDVAPDGFFLCDFSEFVRADFPELFAVIGTKYGPGNGTTTANLPGRAGRVGVGLDSGDPDFDAIGNTGGAKNHTLTIGQMPAHGHVQNSHNHVQDGHAHTQAAHAHTQAAHDHTVQDHNHFATFQAIAASGTARSIISSFAAGQQAVANASGLTNQTTPGINNSTPTINTQTATNQATTATNQNSGSGESHPNVMPFVVSNYIIKY